MQNTLKAWSRFILIVALWTRRLCHPHFIAKKINKFCFPAPLQFIELHLEGKASKIMVYWFPKRYGVQCWSDRAFSGPESEAGESQECWCIVLHWACRGYRDSDMIFQVKVQMKNNSKLGNKCLKRGMDKYKKDLKVKVIWGWKSGHGFLYRAFEGLVTAYLVSEILLMFKFSLYCLTK